MTLQVRGLCSFYGRAQALFDVSLDVGRGEVAALLGRNGAGKSTTLKSIIGFVPVAAGTVVHHDRNLSGLRPHVRCALGIGYVPENRRIFQGLTVLENLEVGRRPARADAPEWTVERVLELFPHLAPLRRRRGDEISGGEQQMLTIARTLMGNPALLLLDEPSTGLAPRVVEHLAEAVSDLKLAGLAILLSEQNLRFAASVADRTVVMETGQVRWRGTMTAFVADPDAAAAYLHV